MKTQLSHKLAVIMLLAVALALPAAAQISHSSSCQTTSASSATSWSCVVNVPANGGVTVFVSSQGTSSEPTLTVSDTNGGSFTRDVENASFFADGYYLAIYSTHGESSNASDTVTVTSNVAKSYTSIQVETWPNVGAAVSSGHNGCGSCGITFSASAGQLVFFGAMPVGTAPTAGSGFTLLQLTAGSGGADQYQIPSSAISNGTASINGGGTGNTNWVAVMAVYPVSSGGGAPCVPTLATLGVGGSCG